MPNPNDCPSCNHKKCPQGGWCYMFKDEPSWKCSYHTNLKLPRLFDTKEQADAMYDPEWLWETEALGDKFIVVGGNGCVLSNGGTWVQRP